MDGGWTLKELILEGIAALLGIVAWFSRQNVSRYDKGLDRLAALERETVTRAELDHAILKVERQIEQRHRENIERFDRLEDQLAPHLEKASEWRHSQATAINAISNKLELLLRSKQR